VFTEQQQKGQHDTCYQDKQESPLPLTDPCNAEAQHMLNIPYYIIW